MIQPVGKKFGRILCRRWLGGSSFECLCLGIEGILQRRRPGGFLERYSSNLQGTIPVELGLLTALTFMDLLGEA